MSYNIVMENLSWDIAGYASFWTKRTYKGQVFKKANAGFSKISANQVVIFLEKSEILILKVSALWELKSEVISLQSFLLMPI